MEAVAGYVRTIAFYMIFSALTEIVAPSGSFKKYIRLILSLILVALLIQPIGGLVRGASGLFEGSYLKFQSMFDNRLLNAERSEYEKEQAQIILAEYKKTLNEQTKQIVEQQTGIQVVGAEVYVNEDYSSTDYASIKSVYITVAFPSYEEEPGRVEQILFGNAGGQISEVKSREAAESKIKNCLADFYNTPKDNIYITVVDNVP